MLPNDANVMMRWGIAAIIDLCKCLSIGKSSCPLLVPALPALFSTTSILDYGHWGVKRAALHRNVCMWLLANSCTEMVKLHCQWKLKIWLWLMLFMCGIAFMKLYGWVWCLVTFSLVSWMCVNTHSQKRSVEWILSQQCNRTIDAVH